MMSVWIILLGEGAGKCQDQPKNKYSQNTGLSSVVGEFATDTRNPHLFNAFT